MSSIWRIIDSGSQSGPTNMAIDEAILVAVAEGQVPPTIRFYSWKPTCLSIGRSQSLTDVDLDSVCQYSYDVVRRPTGGRAILHGDEFTYSVCLSKQDPMVSQGVLSTYERISQGLLTGLKELGVTVDNQSGSDSSELSGPVCFEHRSHYEISANGRKLLGSAQMHSRGGVLQHGSLPLRGDLADICKVLFFDSKDVREEAAVRVRDQAITLSELIGNEVNWKHIVDAFVQGFSFALDVQFLFGNLTESELKNSEKLLTEKYSNLSWNNN
ncbi:MAG TPA: lipoate--protein ligase family protein [Chloroflexi bacterium]|nr:lipoate--protein ligase family protein [Chloroflexota bacterium]